MKFRPLRVLATGMAVPARAVSAAEVDARGGFPAGWTARYSGVLTRYFSEGETASHLGAQAVRQALSKAGLTVRDLDAIICVSGTMQQPIPCNAALLAAELGPETAGRRTFDLNSTCLGFLTGLDVVSAQLAAGCYRRAVIVAADLASAGLDWTERESCSILGDGAAAVIVESGSASSEEAVAGVLGAAFGTWPEGAGLTEIKGGGSGLPASRWTPERAAAYLFHMDGRGVFRLAAERLPGFVEQWFTELGLGWADFDLIIPHQASLSSLGLLQRRLGIPPERFMIYAQDYGNTIAASIPMGLHLALESGRLRAGQRVLLIGTSAGFSLGAVAVQL